RFRLAPLVVCVLLGLAGAAAAQYKVIAPDGRITYTDRAPAPEQGRVVTINGRNAPAAPDNDLPYELRQPASRYPVTLYLATSGPRRSARARRSQARSLRRRPHRRKRRACRPSTRVRSASSPKFLGRSAALSR